MKTRFFTRRTVGQLVLGLAATASPFLASAQPGTPAKLLVGFPPGGSFDTIARVLAEKLKDELQRPVVVENKPGAGGRLAVDALKNAPADGSVVMLGPDALVSMYPLTFKKLNYNPKTDLVPISSILEFPFAFTAGSNPPAKTLAEYVKWARANPQNATFGHPARGTPHHFFGLMLGKAIDVDMQEVPFQGAGPMMVNLMGGQISAGIEVMAGFMEHHKSGKLKVLAVSSPQRMPQMPDVPTFSELGYPTITGMGFNGLYAPPKTEANTVLAWNQALHKVMDRPEVKARFQEMGYLVKTSSPEELRERSARAAAYWKPFIELSGYTAD